jgi:hypothetical protein
VRGASFPAERGNEARVDGRGKQGHTIGAVAGLGGTGRWDGGGTDEGAERYVGWGSP